MSKKEYHLKYGEGKVNFSLEENQVIGELKMRECPVLEHPEQAILEAIRNPIGTKPLREIVKTGETVAIIVNDPTRVANSHVFVPILLNELNSIGVPDTKIRIVFALGTHRAMTQEEMIKEVGPEAAARVQMFNNDCRDQSKYQYFGTTSRGTPVWFNKLVTEVDHIICTGSVVHHFFAGFGGGRKAMLPGVAYYETIRHNHSLMLEPGARIGNLDDNPIYLDQIEGVEMCRPAFLLNTVLNEKKQFLKIFAGDYIMAHQEACKFVDTVYGTEIGRHADLVIATCGGYPKDLNVYQSQKTMDNAICAVKEGGIVILLAECREGSGSALYEKTMQENNTPDKVQALIKKDFQIGIHKAYAVTRLIKRAEFILVSSLDPDLARTLLFTPAKTIEEALQIAFQKLGPNPSIIVMPQGSYTVPRLKNQ
jgi:nickel-dependent lactate racemase